MAKAQLQRMALFVNLGCQQRVDTVSCQRARMHLCSELYIEFFVTVLLLYCIALFKCHINYKHFVLKVVCIL